MGKIVAFINTSHKRQTNGFVRVLDIRSGQQCDYPLYDIQTLSSGVEIAMEGSVSENNQYDISLLFKTTSSIKTISLSVNGSDELVFHPHDSTSVSIDDQVYLKTDLNLDKEDQKLFTLTYGFARIVITVLFRHEHSKEAFLSTKDIPCLSTEEYQGSLITGILEELLDAQSGVVTKWMFTGSKNDPSEYSILEGDYQKSAPKSLASFLQLIETILLEYEKNTVYFRTHAKSQVSKSTVQLPLRKIRQSGNREFLWLSKNTGVFSETLNETGIDYQGRYYIPRYVETIQRIKNYDCYENRLVLGFLEEVLKSTKTIQNGLKQNITSARDIESKLLPLVRDNETFPALALVEQCVQRESLLLDRLQITRNRLQQVLRAYSLALPNVISISIREPRNTKVFQEIEVYSGIFRLLRRWLNFGDFSLAKENLALHTLRVDKLYEYYALYRILEWFSVHGFKEDTSYDEPIQRAEYSLKNRYYSNEKQVATVYNLCSKDWRIRLYYQPVIYGDCQEENGIVLHRLSASNSFKPEKKRINNTYWTPDYLLAIDDYSENVKHFIFDAKFSKAKTLYYKYPREGCFSEILAKYKTDIGALDSGRDVQAVWLFCGREPKEYFQTLEQSAWASEVNWAPRSGIGALTPYSSCLDQVFGEILVDRAKQIRQDETDYFDGSSKEEYLLDGETSQRETHHVLQREWQPQIDQEMLIELCNTYDDRDCLFKANWAQVNLGLSHPFLRKAIPAGRERRNYLPLSLDGEMCFVFSGWLPHNVNRLRSLLEKRRAKT